jgi:protein phosphatase
LIDDQGNSKLTVSSFVQALDAAIQILRNEQFTGQVAGGKITNRFVELEIPEQLAIIGDIHGDLRALLNIFQKIKIDEFVMNQNNKIIFLGDYVDRGSASIEVLYTICSLKIQYPQSIIPMRGNHEAPKEFPIYSHDLPTRMMERFGKRLGMEIYQTKVIELFHMLYLIAIIQGELVLVHGGVPANINSIHGKFDDLIPNTGLFSEFFEEILWNDPRAILPDGREWEISRRGLGKHFSSNISKKWLSASNTKVIVRGHEPCNGFKLDHEGRVLTLFSCKEAYPKYDIGYILISGKQLRSIRDGYDLAESVDIL